MNNLSFEQQMRNDEITSVNNRYQQIYNKLLKKLTEDQMDMIDELLDLERRLTQLEKASGIY
jgi:hypothetical protein